MNISMIFLFFFLTYFILAFTYNGELVRIFPSVKCSYFFSMRFSLKVGISIEKEDEYLYFLRGRLVCFCFVFCFFSDFCVVD